MITPGKLLLCWRCLHFARFVEQLTYYFLSIPEIGALDRVEGVGKIKKAGFCGDTEESPKFRLLQALCAALLSRLPDYPSTVSRREVRLRGRLHPFSRDRAFSGQIVSMMGLANVDPCWR
jgi:hypothetical protein